MSDKESLELHSLPEDVAALLENVQVHPYLLAHLVLVHDAAYRLLEGIRETWPSLTIDADLVLFGAATHDIGKAWHLEEMSGPGRNHHQAGVDLLREQGVDKERARFARTHGTWRSTGALEIEDLLVALADVIWAGGRSQELEDVLTQRLAESEGGALWETFMKLDDILTQITKDAELRLVWQTQFAPERDESEER